ncbi:MAG: hypothetical protein WC229_00980 [Candidatus Paceibacterota bacterium]|jgi:hypothetical protein
MISDNTKQKLLKELEKSGNVYVSCIRVNVERSTFYRWKSENKVFRENANRAINRGKENGSDIAEHSLMQLVKEKDMSAIKYYLGHNSPRYKKPTTNKVVITHQSMAQPDPEKSEVHIEEVFQMADKLIEDNNLEFKKSEAKRIEEKYKDKIIPLKANGEKINEDEILIYEKYIDEYFIKEEIEKIIKDDES